MSGSAVCRNCDHGLDPPLAGAVYCPRCGEPLAMGPLPLRGVLARLVHDYLAPGGPFWRSLGLLIGRPGSLTLLHNQGRRSGYVPPLRLYLIASSLFFLVLGALAAGPHVPVVVGHVSISMGRSGPASIRIALQDARVLRDEAMVAQIGRWADPCLAAGSDCGRPKRLVARSLLRWAENPGASQMVFVRHALAVAPYEIFILLPVYAGIVALACRRPDRHFGEHLTFGLHLHAFWFLAASLLVLLPTPLDGIALVLLACHALAALHAVYGDTWKRSAWKGAAITLAYAVTFLLVTGVLSFCLFVG